MSKSDMNAKIGHNLLRREGPIGARNLLFGRVPFGTIVTHCKETEIFFKLLEVQKRALTLGFRTFSKRKKEGPKIFLLLDLKVTFPPSISKVRKEYLYRVVNLVYPRQEFSV